MVKPDRLSRSDLPHRPACPCPGIFAEYLPRAREASTITCLLHGIGGSSCFGDYRLLAHGVSPTEDPADR